MKNLLRSVLIASISISGLAIAEVKYRPGMDVFLFKIEKDNKLSLIKNASDVDGYDNQPSFSPDNKSVLYVSAKDGKQTDVYQYDISSGKNKRLTFTETSEYSPVMNKGGSTFYAVREGGEPYQSVHLYHYPNDVTAQSKSQWAVSSQTPIGYYAFNSKGTAVGWARWANSMYLFEKDNPYATFITGNAVPSRPFTIPGSDKFSFIHRQANDELWIKSIDPVSRAITPIAPAMNNNYDYAWMPDGSIITGKGSELYRWSKKSKSWLKWNNLTGFELYDISRLAVSSDSKYLAVVAKTLVE
ncbi:MAG: hypothetical protein OQJ89_12805 [Kangiellaceae bacterium]|nr:hypothetical protein [Kangiellaceae bacterium]MCW8999770.1 hypothetical protein [Kangiellaceae bacterium]MCW9017842.1 hypothetical protein [Kangiellaceae bacterium]